MYKRLSSTQRSRWTVKERKHVLSPCMIRQSFDFDGRRMIDVHTNKQTNKQHLETKVDFTVRTGFRREKNRATSGTLLNGCSTKRGSGITDDNNENLKNSDYCIEHGAVYFGGDEAKLINNLDSVQECRDRCLQESGCQYFRYFSFF